MYFIPLDYTLKKSETGGGYVYFITIKIHNRNKGIDSISLIIIVAKSCSKIGMDA